MLALMLMLAIATPATRGEIFGDVRVGEKYVADAKVTLTCGGESATGTTDKSGSFRLKVAGSGKCQFAVTHESKTASVDVVLFEQPSRYRFVLEQQDGKAVLKRV